MRAVFMNLLLLIAFQVIFTLMIAELESDKILTKNYEKMLVGNHEFHEVRNAEEELWRTSEIISKKNLTEIVGLRSWMEGSPGRKTATGENCEISGGLNASRLEEIVNLNNKEMYIIIGDLEGAKCEDGRKAGSTGIKISSGGAARVIWSEQRRYWQS